MERRAIRQAQAREKQEFLEELAAKSARLLGYGQLNERVAAETKPEQALAELEIEPFTTGSVKEYQDQMVRQGQPGLVRYGETFFLLASFIAALTFAALLLVGVPAAKTFIWKFGRSRISTPSGGSEETVAVLIFRAHRARGSYLSPVFYSCYLFNSIYESKEYND